LIRGVKVVIKPVNETAEEVNICSTRIKQSYTQADNHKRTQGEAKEQKKRHEA
jgi:hypothetical protein